MRRMNCIEDCPGKIKISKPVSVVTGDRTTKNSFPCGSCNRLHFIEEMKPKGIFEKDTGLKLYLIDNVARTVS